MCRPLLSVVTTFIRDIGSVRLVALLTCVVSLIAVTEFKQVLE